jgi:hypothetical protein
MHGGALGSGAPKGNQNAVKTGFYRKEANDERRRLKAFLRKSRELLRDLCLRQVAADPSITASPTNLRQHRRRRH